MKSLVCAIALLLASCLPMYAQNNDTVTEVIRVAVQDGQIQGKVFALLQDEKAPVTAKVSLTSRDGKTVSTSRTDESGNFSFRDVEPGTYRAIGIAGDYVGDTQIVVTESEDSEGYYTSIPLAVAPAPSSAIFNTYSSLPAASFAAAPAFGGTSFSSGGCASCSSCTSCGGGGGVGLRSFGGSCGGGCGGGLNFRRLALIGGAIAIPLAIAGGDDDMASPDE